MLYRPEQTLRVPGQSVHESGVFVSHTQRPLLRTGKYSWYSFLHHNAARRITLRKISTTWSGIEFANSWRVAQCLKHLRHRVWRIHKYRLKISPLWLLKFVCVCGRARAREVLYWWPWELAKLHFMVAEVEDAHGHLVEWYWQEKLSPLSHASLATNLSTTNPTCSAPSSALYKRDGWYSWNPSSWSRMWTGRLTKCNQFPAERKHSHA